MAPIKAFSPRANSPYFVTIGHPPVADKFETLKNRDVVTLQTESEIIEAKKYGYLEFKLNFLSDYLCRLAFGLSDQEVRAYINRNLKIRHSKQKVAFYLYKRIKSTEKKIPEHHKQLGLPIT
jgi:hypothetical protein